MPTETTSSDINTKPPLLSEAKAPSSLDTIAATVPSDSAVADVMDAPLPPLEAPQSAPEVPAYPAPLPDPVRSSAAAEKTSKNKVAEVTAEASKEEDSKTQEPAVSSDAAVEPPSTANGVAEVEAEAEKLSVTLPSGQPEAALESPIAQPEELRLPNGLPLPAPQDPDVPVVNMAERDDSPIAEPVVAQQDASTEPSAVTQAAPVENTPVDVSSPSPAVQEVSADPVVQEMPVQPEQPEQPEQPDMVPAVAEDKETETPAPPPAAKEEKPLPTEAAPVSDSASETVPTPPPTAAEEREDTPNPQTVTPTPVETTMQGQLNPRYNTQTQFLFFLSPELPGKQNFCNLFIHLFCKFLLLLCICI